MSRGSCWRRCGRCPCRSRHGTSRRAPPRRAALAVLAIFALIGAAVGLGARWALAWRAYFAQWLRGTDAYQRRFQGLLAAVDAGWPAMTEAAWLQYEATIKRRLAHADEELAAEKEFDRTVVNDFVERAADELVGLLGSSFLTPAQPPVSS